MIDIKQGGENIVVVVSVKKKEPRFVAVHHMFTGGISFSLVL